MYVAVRGSGGLRMQRFHRHKAQQRLGQEHLPPSTQQGHLPSLCILVVFDTMMMVMIIMMMMMMMMIIPDGSTPTSTSTCLGKLPVAVRRFQPPPTHTHGCIFDCAANDDDVEAVMMIMLMQKRS